MESAVTVEGRAKGGLARAAKLSDDERANIAKMGSDARWNVDAEVAIKSGKITIGDMAIPCAVLSDKTRVLSERAITKAFGAPARSAKSRRGSTSITSFSAQGRSRCASSPRSWRKKMCART